MIAAQRAREERERFAELFEQAPTFMAQTDGPGSPVRAGQSQLHAPDRRCRSYRSNRHRSAVPEAAAQGFIELLDQVYRTGEPYAGAGVRFVSHARPNGAADERFLDFVYQPMKDAAGAVTRHFRGRRRCYRPHRGRGAFARAGGTTASVQRVAGGRGRRGPARAQGAGRRRRVHRCVHSGRRSRLPVPGHQPRQRQRIRAHLWRSAEGRRQHARPVVRSCRSTRPT